MNAVWTSTIDHQRRRQRRNRRILVSLMLLVLVLSIRALMPESPEASVPEPDIAKIQPPQPAREEAVPEQASPAVANNIFIRDIAEGDTLSAIFDSFHIDQQAMCQVLAADEQLLALDVLRPGNRLTFTLDQTTRQLQTMELFIHPGRQVIYQRLDADNFEFQEIELPGTWEQAIVNGEIRGNFFLSALSAGLTEQEVANIAGLFEAKLNFSRDIRAGDRFQVVRSEQYVNGIKTGQSQILGIRINGRSYELDAFLFEDGNYYDHNGESMARAFRRYPFASHYRVSSPFNPQRRHPITKRISPHNGTDFAMPSGTSILAAGDGTVTRVKNHPFAGKYIEIKHGSHYETRYLHLSKIMVKQGQHIERGQKIALSGNTGRSTGPHLHYELHLNGRVVNPLKAKIPMAASIPKEKRQQFQAAVTELSAKMDQSGQEFAQKETVQNKSI